MMRSKLGADIGTARLYQKPYRVDFDYIVFSLGWHMPDFVKFSVGDNRTTR
jgi:hypothetical protein